jgi:hypothetical protein
MLAVRATLPICTKSNVVQRRGTTIRTNLLERDHMLTFLNMTGCIRVALHQHMSIFHLKDDVHILVLTVKRSVSIKSGPIAYLPQSLCARICIFFGVFSCKDTLFLRFLLHFRVCRMGMALDLKVKCTVEHQYDVTAYCAAKVYGVRGDKVCGLWMRRMCIPLCLVCSCPQR